MKDETTSVKGTTTTGEFEPVLALLPVALKAVNLDPEQYPVRVEDGKDGERELHVKNQFERTIRLVLQSPDEPVYVLLVAKPPFLDAFVPYATQPYNVDAETLCCRLAHSLRPKLVGGGRSFSKATVNWLVHEAIAQYRQEGQPDPQAVVLGGLTPQPSRTDVVLGRTGRLSTGE